MLTFNGLLLSNLHNKQAIKGAEIGLNRGKD